MIKKAQDRKKIWSIRSIAEADVISSALARKILKDNSSTFSTFKKCRTPAKAHWKKSRLRFAKIIKRRETDWLQTFITDECSFWPSKSKPGKVWTTNPLYEEGLGTHEVKINYWGAISAKGALELVLFEENLNDSRHVEILKRKIPEMKRLYPYGYIFQQDNSAYC